MTATERIESIDDVIEAIDERIDAIESDSRYPEDPEDMADVQVNAVLALMQCDWAGEIKGLKKAKRRLEKLQSKDS